MSIPATETKAPPNGSDRPPVIYEDPKTIVRSPFNRTVDTASPAFKELLEGIRQRGVIQPLIVRPLKPADGPRPAHKRFELIAGERRWMAAQMCHVQTIPVIVRQADDAEAIELQTIENEQRQDLSPIEKAEKYQQLLAQYKKSGLTGKDEAMARLVEKIGKAKSTIYEALALLKLGPLAREGVQRGTLPASHAAVIMKLPQEMQAEIITIVAPGKKLSPKEEMALENLYDFSVEDRDEETGLVSFRETREIVDSVLRQSKEAEKYEVKAKPFRAKGGTALSLLEARAKSDQYIASGDYLSELSRYVHEAVKAAGKHELPTQVMRPKLHDPATTEMVWPKAPLLAALKKAGVKAKTYGGGGSSTNYAKLERARQAKERAKKAILAKILTPLRAAAGKRNAKVPWPLLVSAVAGWRCAEVCRMRGWKATYRNGDEVLKAKTAKLPENQMPGLVADLLIEKFTTDHTGGYQPEFVELATFYGVDAKAIAKAEAAKPKEKVVTLNKREETARKSRTSGKSNKPSKKRKKK